MRYWKIHKADEGNSEVECVPGHPVSLDDCRECKAYKGIFLFIDIEMVRCDC